VSKVLKFGKSQSLEILFEVFNLTNHTNFKTEAPGGYVNRFTSASFGTATAVVPNSQREAEFGVRFHF